VNEFHDRDGRRWLDVDGRGVVFERVPLEAEGMTSPVRCAHCGKIYDLGRVEVVGRYTDCSVWNTPCCNRQVDDRGETGWKGLADYHRCLGGSA
jgi:hypothetical protein